MKLHPTFTSLLRKGGQCWLLAFSLTVTGLAEDAPAAAAYPPHKLANTELRVLPRTRPDRLYQLHIAVPDGFREHPERKYPVVFVTDGYWDFTTVVASYGNLFYGKNVPPMLIVGLGYAGENLNYGELRGDDLIPYAARGEWTASGHAEQFLALIETVAIPLLEREYRADPAHRYMMGCSAGGCFTLYALLTKPKLFQGYVADSPAVDGLQHFEREFVAAGRTTEARVFISAAENEWAYYRKQVGGFYRRLERDGIAKGGLEFHRAPRVRHAGSKPEVYTQGLLYVTEPIAPERGVQGDELTDPENRAGFTAIFWFAGADPAVTPTAAQEEVWLALDARASRLLAEKRIAMVSTTPTDGNRRYATWTFFAKDRAAAEALVREDPAVQSRVLTYELIEAED
jgi:hypothetical protein